MHELAASDAVFVREDANSWRASELSRGPWDPRAQHGGAPCGLLAHIAESAVEGEGWQLARLTVELIRPVPVDSLSSSVNVEAGRTTARVEITLMAQGKPVAKAHALLVRTQAVAPPEETLQRPLAPALSMPAPSDCTAPLRIPGLPDVRSFYYTATESRVAAGDAAAPGPAAAWFRLRVPLVAGAANSPAMRAAAAADRQWPELGVAGGALQLRQRRPLAAACTATRGRMGRPRRRDHHRARRQRLRLQPAARRARALRFRDADAAGLRALARHRVQAATAPAYM